MGTIVSKKNNGGGDDKDMKCFEMDLTTHSM